MQQIIYIYNWKENDYKTHVFNWLSLVLATEFFCKYTLNKLKNFFFANENRI